MKNQLLLRVAARAKRDLASGLLFLGPKIPGQWLPFYARLLLQMGKYPPQNQARAIAAEFPNDCELQIIAGRGLIKSAQHRLSVVVEAEQCFQRAFAANPNSTDAANWIGWSLVQQGRTIDASGYFKRALELDASHALAKEGLRLATEEAGPREDERPEHLRYSKFPQTISELQNLEHAIESHVTNRIPDGAITLTRDSKIVTLGSCFAANITHALKAEGVVAQNLTVGEEVNSSYANLEIVKWSLGDVGDFPEKHLKHTRENVGSMLRSADLVIYTMGVAPCFFDSSGAFALPSKGDAIRGVASGKYVFRTTSVQENVDNIRKIISLIRAVKPDCQFLFTLSPVPLSATLEDRSSFEADCLSKSILRVTAEEVTKAEPLTAYWPSFEIVRWLGGYVPGMYGKEDATTHHVSEDAVALIVKSFVKKFMRTSRAHAEL